jgi:hypothetical protein
LKGADLPDDSRVWHHNPGAGTCRVPPTKGVVLVVTDEKGRETVFGFFQFPEAVKDTHRKVVVKTGLNGAWNFRNFVDSPDPRFREIVMRFEEAGYVATEKDEFP